jgi:hypothetical protein
MENEYTYINTLNQYYTSMGKSELFINNDKRGSYNLTPIVGTTSKPTTQVPPKGPSSITRQDFPSLDNPIRIVIHLMTI